MFNKSTFIDFILNYIKNTDWENLIPKNSKKLVFI